MSQPIEPRPGNDAYNSRQPYTVVLRRPDYMKGANEVVVMLVTVPPDGVLSAPEIQEQAVKAAQIQVHGLDTVRDREAESPDDYALVVLFAGHQQPLQYGE